MIYKIGICAKISRMNSYVCSNYVLWELTTLVNYDNNDCIPGILLTLDLVVR